MEFCFLNFCGTLGLVMIKIKEWLKYGLTLCLLSNVGWFLASAVFF